MKINFKDEWLRMKEDTGWYRPSWATLYYSKAVYEFIWGKALTINDENIDSIKLKIKRIVWELPILFISVMIITLLSVSLGWLK